MSWFPIWRKKTNMEEPFSVHPRGRATFEYREGERRVLVEGELLIGNPDYLIYAGSIRQWQSPHEHDSISDAERREIVAKVGQYLKRSGSDFDVQW